MDREESVLNHVNQPYVQILAMCLRIYNYKFEISTIDDKVDNKKYYFQIDESNNLFYFTFFDDYIEFAINNFDFTYKICLNNNLFCNLCSLSIELQNKNAENNIIYAINLFSDTVYTFTQND